MRSRAFSLVELLVVVTIVAVLAALLFPVFAGAKRSAVRAGCLSNLRQTGTAIGLYGNDADGKLPVGTIVRWQNFDDKGHLFPPDGTRDVIEPLLRYAGGSREVLKCPANDGVFVPRWVVAVGKEERLMVPDSSNVLVQCMHHLAVGWSGGRDWEHILAVSGRKGNHLVIRADLSVGTADSQTLRSLVPQTKDGQETWVAGSNDFGFAHGVFTSERWPPEWTPLPEALGLNWGKPG